MEDDPAFRAELLATFYHEVCDHLRQVHKACTAFTAGSPGAPGAPSSSEQVIKDEAHAIKGSAATLGLDGAAAAAAGVEDPAKQMVACAGGLSPEDRSMLLRAFCVEPATELRALVKEVRGAVAFTLSWLKTKEEGLDFSAEGGLLEPEESARLAKVSLAGFDEKVLRPFAELWGMAPEKLLE